MVPERGGLEGQMARHVLHTQGAHAHRQRRCSLWRPGNPTLGQVAGAWRLQNNYVWTAYANEREKIRRSLLGMDVEVMCQCGALSPPLVSCA